VIGDLAALIQALARHEVRFILVGGAAAAAHGSARLTQDVDVVSPAIPATSPGSWPLWPCPILGLEKLIEVKRAAGRPKDYETVAELEAILEKTRRGR
jgi:predicted nucleotidyltransferase